MKEYQSKLSAIIHSTMEDLHGIGVVKRQTLRKYDELCLKTVEPLSADEIKQIREKEMVSQPVFAKYLNVSKGIISAWERGVKKPSGPALKLLTMVKERGLETLL
ncbi:MAG: DNA-binding transcriptional regulator [Pseudomonadota bacterium]